MLDLKLREEFLQRRLQGTAIDLANEDKTGATQVPAADFLEITYPTGDVLKAIEAIGPGKNRPVVTIGDRGIGKSHLLAALHHALSSPGAVRAWLGEWSLRLNDPRMGNLTLRDDLLVISEGLQQQRYKFLWDLLFDNHPKGDYIRGKWEAMAERKTHVPPDSLILELLQDRPVALLLDEYQTWFDGLIDTRQEPYQRWAFNFIQNLTRIAKDRPDLLVLVVSVRNGTTDAYQQIHREHPVLIEFKGQRAEQDRRRLLLHRLFSNRLQVPTARIEALIAPHLDEYLRMTNAAPSEHDGVRAGFTEIWPFSPHLMRLLEDQVLVATDAQETRDLIRILADLYKRRGASSPTLTAADFRLDDEESGITALLSSVSNRHHASLRDIALRNLTAVRGAVQDPAVEVPHLEDIVSALWLRSLATGNQVGATAADLHVDITRESLVDDNAFQVELAAIEENSFNIHHSGDRLVFKEEENPQAKLLATARNDRLFEDGSDRAQLAKQVRYVLSGTDDVAHSWRVIVLGEGWLTAPWEGIAEADRPENWDERQLPHIVLPESPGNVDAELGPWLRDQVSRRRNTLRFLIPKGELGNMYRDRELLVMARAVLKATEWKEQAPEYSGLKTKYERELRSALKQRFDRFAVLSEWDFGNPERCVFQVERMNEQGEKIPLAIEKAIEKDVFVPEDFEAYILAAAAANKSLADVLSELKEPRPNGEHCVAWLGETETKERTLRQCAERKLAINNREGDLLQALPGEGKEAAWQRLLRKLGSLSHPAEARLMLPQAIPASGGEIAQPALSAALVGATAAISAAAAAPAAPAVTSAGVPGNLFAAPPDEVRYVSHLAPATSPLNLLARIESWGIQPGTPLQEVKLRIDGASGAQLRALLKDLPENLTYELSVDKPEA